MPTYEYECQAKKCGALSEVVQSIHEEPLKKCPQCKRGKVIKLISLTARPVVPGHPLDEIQKMKLEAKKIAQKIVNGDEKAIADVYGEDVAAGKAPKNTSKPKQLKDVKGKSAVRRSK